MSFGFLFDEDRKLFSIESYNVSSARLDGSPLRSAGVRSAPRETSSRHREGRRAAGALVSDGAPSARGRSRRHCDSSWSWSGSVFST
jgi:hypothetical protein